MRAVPVFRDPVLVGRLAAVEAVPPVGLDEQEPSAFDERLARGAEYELGVRGVVERVVEQARVEADLGSRIMDLEQRLDFVERRLVQEQRQARLPEPPKAKTPV